MKKTTYLVLVLFLCIFAFASCNVEDSAPTPPDNQTDIQKPGTDKPDEQTPAVLWNKGTDLTIIAEKSLENLDDKYFNSDTLVLALFSITEKDVLYFTSDTAPEKKTAELLIGNTGRDVSDNAYSRLNNELYIDGVEYFDGWLIYAEGDSLALAYTNEYGMRMGIKHLRENLIKDHFAPKNGVVASDRYTYSEKVDEAREEERDKAFDALEAQGVDSEIVNALRKLYSLYNAKTYLWIADLYDPEGGGFYFSNSARNNEGYLPDLESTVQALRFLGNSGIFADYGGNYAEGISDEIKEELINFARNLQSSEDGYFYHPQWGKNNGDVIENYYDSRLGRDLGWGTGLLRDLGAQPLYNAPDGTLGELGAPGSTPASALILPFSSSVSMSVSKLTVSTVNTASSYLPTHLQSMKNWRNYITNLFAKFSSYEAGNTLNAQQGQIKNAGQEYIDYLIAYLDEKQNPSTGLWESPVDYNSVNGLMKLASVYNYFNMPIPNVDKAMESTIKVALRPDGDAHVCSIYNPWVIMNLLIQSAEKNDKTSGTQKAEELRAIVYENAAELILLSYNKLEKYFVGTGGFHYHSTNLTHTSQGAPVACAKEFEADVNATTICSNGIPRNIFESLGLDFVTPYYHEDYIQFTEKINNLSPIIKNPPVPIPGVSGDRGQGVYFNDPSADGTKLNMTISTGETEWIEAPNWSQIKEGVQHVGGSDKAAYFFRPGDEYTYLYASYRAKTTVTTPLPDHTMIVEFDMAFKDVPADTESVYRYAFFYGKVAGANSRVHLLLHSNKDGRIEFTNTALHTSETYAPMKQDLWYNLRFEIYNSGNVKVFINNEYALTLAGEIRVSDVTTRVNFNIINPVDGSVGFVLDNLYMGAISKKFESEDPNYVEIKAPKVSGSTGEGVYYKTGTGKKFDFSTNTMQTEHIENPGWTAITDGIKLSNYDNNSVFLYRPNDKYNYTYARYDGEDVTSPGENHVMIVEHDIAFTGLAPSVSGAYMIECVFGKVEGANSKFSFNLGSDENGNIILENKISHQTNVYKPFAQNTYYNIRFELYSEGYAKVFINNEYALTISDALATKPATVKTRVNFYIKAPKDDNHGLIIDNLYIGQESKAYVSEAK